MTQADEKPNLHIFVNRRKFESGDGVQPLMTRAAIAGLVEVPPSNAVVRYDSGPNKGKEIETDDPIEVKNGDHFLVTRRVVEGG
jgi:hypothetical protein